MKRAAKPSAVIEPPLPLRVESSKGVDGRTIDTMAKAVIARYPRVMAKLAE